MKHKELKVSGTELCFFNPSSGVPLPCCPAGAGIRAVRCFTHFPPKKQKKLRFSFAFSALNRNFASILR